MHDLGNKKDRQLYSSLSAMAPTQNKVRGRKVTIFAHLCAQGTPGRFRHRPTKCQAGAIPVCAHLKRGSASGAWVGLVKQEGGNFWADTVDRNLHMQLVLLIGFYFFSV